LLQCLMDFGDLQRCKHGLKGRLGIDGFLKNLAIYDHITCCLAHLCFICFALNW
jgi:hypothetical protein